MLTYPLSTHPSLNDTLTHATDPQDCFVHAAAPAKIKEHFMRLSEMWIIAFGLMLAVVVTLWGYIPESSGTKQKVVYHVVSGMVSNFSSLVIVTFIADLGLY